MTNPAPHTTTPHLTRLRTRMLATAYANADFWTRRNALMVDQAVAVLARLDPTVAENLARSVDFLECQSDTRILGAAVEAGIDTTGWEERREKTRAYSEGTPICAGFDPDGEAKRIWGSLYSHYPQIAQALAELLLDLPDTWRQDLFTRGLPSPLPQQRPEQPGPETAPYDTCWEDCEACTEAQGLCRYHRGVQDGIEYQLDLIRTVLTDPIAAEQLEERHAELARTAPDTTAAAGDDDAAFLTSTAPAHTATRSETR